MNLAKLVGLDVRLAGLAQILFNQKNSLLHVGGQTFDYALPKSENEVY